MQIQCTFRRLTYFRLPHAVDAAGNGWELASQSSSSAVILLCCVVDVFMFVCFIDVYILGHFIHSCNVYYYCHDTWTEKPCLVWSSKRNKWWWWIRSPNLRYFPLCSMNIIQRFFNILFWEFIQLSLLFILRSIDVIELTMRIFKWLRRFDHGLHNPMDHCISVAWNKSSIFL